MHIIVAIFAALLLAQPAAEAPTPPVATFAAAPPATQALMRREHKNYIRLPDGRIFDRRNELERDRIRERNGRSKQVYQGGSITPVGSRWEVRATLETIAWGLIRYPEGYDLESPPPMWWSPKESIEDPRPYFGIGMVCYELVQVIRSGEALVDPSIISNLPTSGGGGLIHVTGLPRDMVDGEDLGCRRGGPEDDMILLPRTEPYQYDSVYGQRTVSSFHYIDATAIETLTPEELFDAIRDGKAEISRWINRSQRYRTDEGERRTRITWERKPVEVRLKR